MINIPANFISREMNNNKCICKKIEDMNHIYECEVLNREKAEVEFKKIYNGTITEQKKISKRFQLNMEQRSKIINEPCDPSNGDLLSSVVVE